MTPIARCGGLAGRQRAVPELSARVLYRGACEMSDIPSDIPVEERRGNRTREAEEPEEEAPGTAAAARVQ